MDKTPTHLSLPYDHCLVTQQNELEAEMKATLGEGWVINFPKNVGYVRLFADSKHYCNVDDPNTLESMD